MQIMQEFWEYDLTTNFMQHMCNKQIQQC